jgi:hypothetical protein
MQADKKMGKQAAAATSRSVVLNTAFRGMAILPSRPLWKGGNHNRQGERRQGRFAGSVGQGNE